MLFLVSCFQNFTLKRSKVTAFTSTKSFLMGKLNLLLVNIFKDQLYNSRCNRFHNKHKIPSVRVYEICFLVKNFWVCLKCKREEDRLSCSSLSLSPLLTLFLSLSGWVYQKSNIQMQSPFTAPTPLACQSLHMSLQKLPFGFIYFMILGRRCLCGSVFFISYEHCE